jgi:2-carboxy-1,4-naphthoquinone phytyltransferase
MTNDLMTTNNIDYPQQKLWMAAIKPPMYSVAIMPILLGTAVAYTQNHTINYAILGIFLISAILILAWENLYNDVFDSETGIDKNKHHSLVNLTQNKSLVFWIANLFLALGILGIIAISWFQQDLTVIALILFACFFGYMYQGPPFRLGYLGLGEILCFIAFGPVGISAVYYSQMQSFSVITIPIALIVGITTTIVLFCSHFHQIEDDIAAGKRSPIVRLGTAKGAQVLQWSCLSIYLLNIIFAIAKILPVTSLIMLMSLPFALKLINHVNQYHDQPEKVSNSKFLAINLQFVSGILLGLGLIV